MQLTAGLPHRLWPRRASGARDRRPGRQATWPIPGTPRRERVRPQRHLARDKPLGLLMLLLILLSAQVASPTTVTGLGGGNCLALASCLDNSLLRELQPEPDHHRHAPNKQGRDVNSGHYVPVEPTALPKPYLIAHSPELAGQLGLTEADVKSSAFLSLFSGGDRPPGFGMLSDPASALSCCWVL